ncbi:aminotransferase class IV [Maribacter algarum]|uniref:branched-chain-amino-acid transaminase n=1 Tax=Maribacter algarum (ex Zhang et al. 2020) TaxID=2578118 RepID=A0A5S3PUE6_9FLAO|nr:aminotransferase class IV [Maribacter algarum]TMM57553.1 aminotransferase class IV [Maribacter algarum]
MIKSVNFNGRILPESENYLSHENRGLRYGDSLFEAIRVSANKIFFWEDHYLRLMASMRILRMDIPMNFTLEFLESEILKTVASNGLSNSSVRIRLTVFRNNGGLYLPETNEVSFCIEANVLPSPFYVMDEENYEVELFKDFYVNADMMSTLKTNNRILNVVGSVFAKENGYDNCILLNQKKEVVEFLNGNIFLVKANSITTPSLKDGCLNGILRKKLIEILGKLEDYDLQEVSISPFDLQKADELFLTNSITGIRSITKYRKKEFTNLVAKDLIGKLNAAARLT